jgi:methylglutaconyl-CoA hydratase
MSISDRPFEGFEVHLDPGNGVANIILNRPRGNRFSLGMLTDLLALLRSLHQMPDLRAVLLTALGDDFSHGADLQDPAMAEQIAGGEASRRSLAENGQALIDQWSTLPVPTIVAARGRSIGAGACLFTAADFRFTGETFSIQFPEVDRGMHLSWGILPRLTREFGWPATRRLALAGEILRSGDLPAGVATMAPDPEQAANDFAARLAAKPPLAVRSIKKVLTQVANGHPAAEDAGLFAETVGSADFAEAMAAWFEKRPGKYEGS